MIGRKQFGRISIANSDAAASAYTDAAIDQAYRAVQEQLKKLSEIADSHPICRPERSQPVRLRTG